MNIIQQISELLLNSNQISQASTNLGESENNTQKAVTAIIPLVFSALSNKSKGSFDSVNSLFNFIPNNLNTNINSVLMQQNSDTDIASLSNESAPLINSLFGNKISGITTAIQQYSGVSAASISALMATIVPSIIGYIKNIFNQNNITSNKGRQQIINQQQQYIANYTPLGLNMNDLLDINKMNQSQHNANVQYDTQDNNNKSNGWILWVLLLAIAGLLLWFFSKGCKDESVTTPIVNNDTITTTTAPPAPPVNNNNGSMDANGNWIYNVGNDKVIKLADNSEMTVGENSTEAQLFDMLSNENFKVDTVDKTNNWVHFDRTYFETGKSILTAASQEQIKRLALILKNFPNASIKIGGYTDNTGSEEVNRQISKERALIVADQLVKNGAAKNQVVQAEGYGPEFPIASNDTEEGKAQNRRVDLKVATK